MHVFELFDARVPVEVLSNTDTKFRARFMAGKQAYIFEASGVRQDPATGLKNLWHVEFKHEQYRSDGNYATGTGDEFKVFSAVKQLMDQLVRKIEDVQIGGIIFEGTTLEPTRLKIYARYANQLARRANWTHVPSGSWFILLFNQQNPE